MGKPELWLKHLADPTANSQARGRMRETWLETVSQKPMAVCASESPEGLGRGLPDRVLDPWGAGVPGVPGRGAQGRRGRRGRLAGKLCRSRHGACGCWLSSGPAPASLPHVTQEGLRLPPHTPCPQLPPPSRVLCHPAREVHSSWASSVGQVTTQEEMDMGTQLESQSDDRGEQGKQAGQSPRTPASGGRPPQVAGVLHRRLSGRGQELRAPGSRA